MEFGQGERERRKGWDMDKGKGREERGVDRTRGRERGKGWDFDKEKENGERGEIWTKGKEWGLDKRKGAGFGQGNGMGIGQGEREKYGDWTRREEEGKWVGLRQGEKKGQRGEDWIRKKTRGEKERRERGRRESSMEDTNRCPCNMKINIEQYHERNIATSELGSRNTISIGVT